MPRSLDQFAKQRDVVLRDDAGKLPSGDRDALLGKAITERYSKDRPLQLASDVNGAASNLLALPTSSGGTFEEGFSIVKTIEFPIGDAPPTLIDDANWRMYRTPTALKIMLDILAPSASDTLRITWTARHKDDATTVPDPDFYAVCDLAAALCYEALAGIYAQTGDASLSADSVNYRTKSQEYLSLAKALAKRYYEHLGINPSDTGAATGPAGASFSMHETMGWGGDRLTHPRSTR